MYEDFLAIGSSAADAAAEVISNRPNIVNYKGRTDLVTDIDQKSEDIIIDIISTAYPDHSIMAEESGKQTNDSDFTWVIDPLDGTTNFVHQYPSFGISIALIHNNESIVGIIRDIPGNNHYTAIINQGAFCNGEKMEVSKTTKLDKSLLVTGFGYIHDETWHANMELFKEFTDITQGVRRLGAAALDLCHVARGFVDGYWEFQIKPWDIAAGILMVQEAGGIVTRMDGKNISIYDQQIVATNSALLPAILKYTKPVIQNLTVSYLKK